MDLDLVLKPPIADGQMMDETANVPTLEIRTKHQEEEAPLTDEELLLASPILYGFSLSDKIWCEYATRYVLARS